MLTAVPHASGILFNDLQEVIMLSSGPVSTALKVVSDNGAGLILGAIDPTTLLSSVTPFGTTRDTFLAKVGPSNGLNIVSTNDTNDSGFIAFFVNGDYEVKNGKIVEHQNFTPFKHVYSNNWRNYSSKYQDEWDEYPSYYDKHAF